MKPVPGRRAAVDPGANVTHDRFQRLPGCGASPCPGCGLLFANCSSSSLKGSWALEPSTGALQYTLPAAAARGEVAPPPPAPKCLAAHAQASVGGFYGGPKAAMTTMGGCPSAAGFVNTRGGVPL